MAKHRLGREGAQQFLDRAEFEGLDQRQHRAETRVAAAREEIHNGADAEPRLRGQSATRVPPVAELLHALGYGGPYGRIKPRGIPRGRALHRLPRHHV